MSNFNELVRGSELLRQKGAKERGQHKGDAVLVTHPG